MKHVGFTQTTTVTLNAIGWWDSEHEEPIFLITNLDDAYEAYRYYRRRFRIETFFSDQKSRCFHIHKSHLAKSCPFEPLIDCSLPCLYLNDYARLARDCGRQIGIDYGDRRDKSLFRLGID